MVRPVIPGQRPMCAASLATRARSKIGALSDEIVCQREYRRMAVAEEAERSIPSVADECRLGGRLSRPHFGD